MVRRIAQAVEGGVDLVQVREKDLPGGELLALAREVTRAVAGRALLLINERADVAAAADADGVQLGENALPTPAVRRAIGPDALIGRSVHSPEGALKAQAGGADFVLVGAMYPTRSHPEALPAGPGLVRGIAGLPEVRASALPLIGIGGITADNVGEVIRAGAAGVAVISAILASPDPKGEAQKLRHAMTEAWSAPGPR